MTFQATLEQKQADLPVYLMVPTAVPEGFGRDGTFVVDAISEGKEIGRRSIKPWGDGRWFMELTKPQLANLGLHVGASIALEVSLAQETPDELTARIRELGLEHAWNGLSEAQRRAFSESIFEAKRPTTRAARVERTLVALRGR